MNLKQFGGRVHAQGRHIFSARFEKMSGLEPAPTAVTAPFGKVTLRGAAEATGLMSYNKIGPLTAVPGGLDMIVFATVIDGHAPNFRLRLCGRPCPPGPRLSRKQATGLDGSAARAGATPAREEPTVARHRFAPTPPAARKSEEIAR
ncbi:hypothetical protein JT55_14175 [Rhodovulum sp. NI22]|jgi:hypothetical protein|nr:hypothetical protein JT55_14175 [Rhodovulum sp. NI22]